MIDGIEKGGGVVSGREEGGRRGCVVREWINESERR